MTYEEQLIQYLLEFNQDIRASVEAESSSSLEEKATEYMTQILAEAGETESPLVCSEIKEDRARRVVHKINGYSISEDEETIDGYVTWFEENNHLRSFTKANIEQAANQSERFFKNSINGYSEELDEAAPIYHFAYRLGLPSVRKKIIRIRIFILTNARYIGKFAIPDRKIGDILVQFHVWDLDRFFALQASSNNREPITIDFASDHGGVIECLAMPIENDDYQSYLAILPGKLIASIYEKYGARLLEQNVRSFLQFGNKVNKGIRDTIKNEPHRFLAYNNGIAATAASVKFKENNQKLSISTITDLQIVNGGQTTAAIFQTNRVDKTDLSKVFVQMKLTVIKDHTELENIVPRISRYANSQNAIKEADLSSNHPFNIALEKLSRTTYTPANQGTTLQTRWYFERARGQYRVSLNRELTISNKKSFEIKNPKKQLFTKELMAKVLHSWYLKPHYVARGAQKNYALFISELNSKEKNILGLDSKKLPSNVFYEDLISLLILQNSIEFAYGRGTSRLGDIKFLTVPFTLSFINFATDGRIDLPKIWKHQSISEVLFEFIEYILPLVEKNLKTFSEGRLIGEYAKREEAWSNLKKMLDVVIVPPILQSELVSKEYLSLRVAKSEQVISEETFKESSDLIKSFTSNGWKLIEEWGRINDTLSTHKQSIAYNVALALRNNRALTTNEVSNALQIIDIVGAKHPSLLDNLILDNKSHKEDSFEEVYDITLVEQLFSWERKNKRLSDSHFNWIKKIKDTSEPLTQFQIKYLKDIVSRAVKYGFIPKQSPPLSSSD